MQPMEIQNLKDILKSGGTDDTMQWAIERWIGENAVPPIDVSGQTAHTGAQGFPAWTYLGIHDSDLGYLSKKQKCAVFLGSQGYLEVVLKVDPSNATKEAVAALESAAYPSESNTAQLNAQAAIKLQAVADADAIKVAAAADLKIREAAVVAAQKVTANATANVSNNPSNATIAAELIAAQNAQAAATGAKNTSKAASDAAIAAHTAAIAESLAAKQSAAAAKVISDAARARVVAAQSALDNRAVPAFLETYGNILVPKRFALPADKADRDAFVAALTASGYASGYTTKKPDADLLVKHIATRTMVQASWDTTVIPTIQTPAYLFGAYADNSIPPIIVDAWGYYKALRSGAMDAYIYKNTPQGQVGGVDPISTIVRVPGSNPPGLDTISGAFGPILFSLNDGATAPVNGVPVPYNLMQSAASTAGFSSLVTDKLW